jgi:hypothetical protein
MPVNARSYRTNAIIPRRTSMRGRRRSKRSLAGTSMRSKIRSTRIKANTKLAAIAKSQAVRRTTVSATRMGWLAYLGDASASTARTRSHVASTSLYWTQSRRYISIMRVCRIVRPMQKIALTNKGNSS